MEISLKESVGHFLAATTAFRAAHPFETNIISSVAQSVQEGSRTYDAYFWWVIKDDSNSVIGIAMRTAPHGMLLSPMSELAVTALAIEVAKLDDQLTGVAGPRSEVETFLKAYRDTLSLGSARAIEIAGQELLYILKDLKIPNVIGEMRTALDSEYQLLHDWFLAFAEEAEIYMHDPRETIEDGLRRGALRWWIVADEIVSLAGHAPIVNVPGGSIARIGPVYTPPERRRHGYAGALTSALSEELANKGAKVMLHTDASNPTSNSIYQKIGYIKIGENLRIAFETLK